MATTIYPGSLSPDESDLVYEGIIHWIETHNYRITGPYREIYHHLASTDETVEIQFPIQK